MTDSALSAPKKANERYTAAEIITAVQETRGFVSVIARKLHCDPDTVRNYAKRYPTIAAALKEERERTTDIAEAALFKAIQEGEAWAVCFYLKTQGKNRGYVERVETEQHGDITIRIEYDDSDPAPAPLASGASGDRT